MSRKAKQQYVVTRGELSELAAAGTHGQVGHAIDRCRRIESVGGQPVVYYSAHHGFLILDLGDQEDEKLHRLLEPHALPFVARITNHAVDA